MKTENYELLKAICRNGIMFLVGAGIIGYGILLSRDLMNIEYYFKYSFMTQMSIVSIIACIVGAGGLICLATIYKLCSWANLKRFFEGV